MRLVRFIFDTASIIGSGINCIPFGAIQPHDNAIFSGLFSGNYQVADFLWSVVDDGDLVRYALEFLTFVAADETFREYFSKDLNLISAVRHLAEQVNENCKSALQQFHKDLLVFDEQVL